jgi:hypothetical protein
MALESVQEGRRIVGRVDLGHFDAWLADSHSTGHHFHRSLRVRHGCRYLLEFLWSKGRIAIFKLLFDLVIDHKHRLNRQVTWAICITSRSARCPLSPGLKANDRSGRN